ncbi:Ig-like domain-containing protein [Listeria aquatica]
MYVTKGNIQLKAPLINAVTTQDTTVSGTADPNTTIKLNISTDSYEAKVDAEGNFKVLLDHTYPVNSLISVYSTDGQHKSLVTNAKVVQGSFKLGVNMITDTDRILTGMALPNSKIKVQVGNRIYEGQASTLGTFMIQMSQSYKAGQNIEITATDPASGRTESKVIIVYPESPSINTILPGTSAVSGQASPNAFVVVQIGGQNYSGLANAAGYFFIAINPNDAVVGAEIAVTQISNNIESLPTRVLIGS